MKPLFSEQMADALALVKNGQLGQATALIQRNLGLRGAAPVEPAPDSAGETDYAAADPLAPEHSTPEHFLVHPEPEAAPGDEPAPAGRRARGDDRPAGSFTSHTFAGEAGHLHYRLYLPATARASMPLVVMLHGCTQSAEDFARGTQMNALADELGFIVAYPEQTQAANAQKCWNWFRPGDQDRGRGEPALIAGIAEEIVAAHAVDPRRVYVAGLSAGGAAAAIMAAAYPDIFAAVGIHSGLACGAARDLPSALAAMQGRGAARPAGTGPYVPTITFHGSRDRTVHPSNSRAIHAAGEADPRIATLEREVTESTSAGGRRYRRVALVDGKGVSWAEHWDIAAGPHAWSGGSAEGTYTDPAGPDASREMMRFFLQHARGRR